MQTTSVWLIRHGEPEPESRGRCYGRLDVGLSEAGRRQLEAVARRLGEVRLSAIYASPRRRAVQSAEIVALGQGCAVEIEAGLAEIDFGDFEGRPYDEIQRSHPEIYRQWMERPTEVQFPNGESFVQMRARVLGAARRLLDRHRGETVAVVTHGGVNRIWLTETLGMPAAHLFRIGQAYGAMNLIRYLDEAPSVELVNGAAG